MFTLIIEVGVNISVPNFKYKHAIGFFPSFRQLFSTLKVATKGTVPNSFSIIRLWLTYSSPHDLMAVLVGVLFNFLLKCKSMLVNVCVNWNRLGVCGSLQI